MTGIWKTSTHTTAMKKTGQTAYHEDVTEVVSLATQLQRAELAEMIRQYRKETWQQRKDLQLSYDEGLVRCIDWGEAPLVVEEEGLLGGECWGSERPRIDAISMTRMLTPSTELKGRNLAGKLVLRGCHEQLRVRPAGHVRE